MTIAHEAYLLGPTQFATRIVELTSTSSGDRSASYRCLREEALAVFIRNPIVEKLADRYGGWDERSLRMEVPPIAGSDPGEFAIWMSLILYDLFPQQQSLLPRGLNETWRETEAALVVAGWSSNEIKLVIDGRPFVSLIAEMSNAGALSHYAVNDLRSLFANFRLPSTASSVGWLSFQDIIVLQQRLVSVNSRNESLKRLRHLFDDIIPFETGLCIIKSG